MALILYHGAGSPYGWRVWMALEHKRLDYELRVLSFDEAEMKQAAYLAINPRGKVPAIDDGGFTLFESGAILEYLDERFPQAPLLFPGTAERRALIRRKAREAEQYAAVALETLVWAVFYTPREHWDEALIARGREEFARELAYWEGAIDGPGLAGAWSAADFTLYPLIALALRIERVRTDLALRTAISPRLAAWMARVEALPWFARTWPSHWERGDLPG